MDRDQDAPARLGRRHMLRAGGLLAAGAGVGALAQPGVAGAAGYGFTPVDPYRAFDTRNGSGKIYFEQDLATTVWDDVNGDSRIPSGVAAVAYNLTVAETEGAGFLGLYPGDRSYAGTSSINWIEPDVNLANGGIIRVGPLEGTPGVVGVHCSGTVWAGAHVIIDITGYYS